MMHDCPTGAHDIPARSCYVHHHCGCDGCREADALYRRELRDRKPEPKPNADVGPRPRELPTALGDWACDAWCLDTEDEKFFAESPSGQQMAADLCRRHCPVVEECLEHALASDERLGVWGGTTEWERRALRERGVA